MITDPVERQVFRHPAQLPAEEIAGGGRPNDQFDALHYDLDLTVDPGAHHIGGTATVTVECVSATDTLALDLVGLLVDQVLVDGVISAYSQGPSGLDVEGDFEPGDTYQVAVRYGGEPELAHDTLGFNFAPGVSFTYTEPDGSAYWFPCFDDPADKATLRLAITAPADLEVAANGLKTGEVSLPGGLKQTVWEHDYPTAPYLVAVAISDYVVLEDEVDGLPLVHWAYPHREEEAAADFAMHRDMVPMYEEIFGIDYPFDKYGAAMVPIGGAMEHQTCTAMGEGLVDGNGTFGLVFAHELAHHWWGDLVTCATWDDIWLNEGFATFSEALAVEYIYGEDYYTQYVEGLAESYIAWNEWEGVFPLSEPGYMWGGTVYDK
ncbi:MAG: M1 family metallopeptidase, partial [Myxococcota bacterium]|nr:M1 family metallopeptidase [Myxococcota bacterium]